MDCKCIEEIEKKMIGREIKGKKVIKASLISGGIIFGKRTQFITTSEIECEVEGMKKKPIQQMIHSFCPFCGKKIDN